MWLLAEIASAQSWPKLDPIPTGEGSRDAAVIVAIDNYTYVEDVPGAALNAEDWYRWFRIGRGIPADRVVKLVGPAASKLAIEKAAEAGANKVLEGGTLWFVFIGHGAPARDGQDGLLVAVDARQDAEELYAASVPRSAVIARLEAGAPHQTVVLLDACFSGMTGPKRPLVPGLQTMVPEYGLGTANDTTRVLTAAGSSEFTGPLPGANRPAFSYLALGGLMGWADVPDPGTATRDGKVTLYELRDYVQGALQDAGRAQTVTALAKSDVVLGKAVTTNAPNVLEVVSARVGPSHVAETQPPFLFESTIGPKLCASAARTKGEEVRAMRLADAATALRSQVAWEWTRARPQLEACAASMDPAVRTACVADLERFVAMARALTATVGPSQSTATVDGVTCTVSVDAASLAVDAPEISFAQALHLRIATPPGFVRVEPGTFWMGSPPNEYQHDERYEALHEVTLTNPFWISATEVTQGEYESLMGRNPVESESTHEGEPCAAIGGISLVSPRYPVVCVTLLDAVTFANARSKVEGLTPAYGIVQGQIRRKPGANGYRLPTEEEWEYAARAGSRAAWGGDVAEIARVCEIGNIRDLASRKYLPWSADCNDGFAALADVGSFAPNAWGLYDVVGNVMEMTDGFQIVEDWEGKNPELWPTSRGGSYSGQYSATRLADRAGWGSNRRQRDQGFRLARSI